MLKRCLNHRPLLPTAVRNVNVNRNHVFTLSVPFSSVSSSPPSSPHDRLLVIGSGVAGSAAALIAAELYHIPVTMLFAGRLPTDCNSYWAQGGIIYRNFGRNAAGDRLDSAELLCQDIHRAGAGRCWDAAVRKVAAEGPDRVRQLLLAAPPFASVPFDRCAATGELALCLEASHTAPRILHQADHTGRIITQHITEAAARHPLITQVGHTVVTDLVVANNNNNNNNNNNTEDNNATATHDERVCVGVETLNRTTNVRAMELATRGVVLATGGLAGIYQHSTNPIGFNALGSSVGLAIRANVKVQDLEYVQFHPTSLCLPNTPRFLLTEALRGEGAVLRDASGRAFARDYHPDGELAPRDVVARAVFEESQKSSVFLDITHRDRHWLHQRFPSIQAHLSQHNLDLGRDWLPIIPAAHYTCGGVATDLDGRTSLPGLFAAGEAARTGLHGANRLASTSLLEGLVFGAAVADFVGTAPAHQQHVTTARAVAERYQQQPLRWRGNYRVEPFQIENAAHRAVMLLGRLRQTMWDAVGVVRTPLGLLSACEELNEMNEKACKLHVTCPTLETAAVRDAAGAGLAVAKAALANKTSTGAHCVVPDPEMEEEEQMAAAAR